MVQFFMICLDDLEKYKLNIVKFYSLVAVKLTGLAESVAVRLATHLSILHTKYLRKINLFLTNCT